MITLDGKKLSEFGMIMQAGHEHPMTPVIENKTLAVPGKTGIYYFGSDIRERVINLPLAFNVNDRTENTRRIREFAEFLHDNRGNPRVIKLFFDAEPDKYYTVILAAQFTPDKYYGTTSFTLPLLACDPYAYSQVLADEITWGSTAITFLSSYLLGRGASDGLKTVTGVATLNILVDGLAIKPIIEITGSATSLVITANGYTITIGTFTSSTWLIDCEKYTVLKNGASAFGSVTLREFLLLPGVNAVTIGGTGLNFIIHIKARDRYI